MALEFSASPLFQGLSIDDISSLLNCLGGIEREYQKETYIFSEGTLIDQLGVVLEGRVLIQCSDIWGINSILGSVGPGSVFGEAYACCPGEPLQISVMAAEHTRLLFLNINRVLTTCPASCPFHTKLIRNLLTISAQKNLELSRRMLHTTSKTIRGRLLSYFSTCAKLAQSNSFDLSYNRQQLADYLGVDRSAMCGELSKMQRDGLILYSRRHVEICHQTASEIKERPHS